MISPLEYYTMGMLNISSGITFFYSVVPLVWEEEVIITLVIVYAKG